MEAWRTVSRSLTPFLQTRELEELSLYPSPPPPPHPLSPMILETSHGGGGSLLGCYAPRDQPWWWWELTLGYTHTLSHSANTE
jgi:hypothetical protein